MALDEISDLVFFLGNKLHRAVGAPARRARSAPAGGQYLANSSLILLSQTRIHLHKQLNGRRHVSLKKRRTCVTFARVAPPRCRSWLLSCVERSARSLATFVVHRDNDTHALPRLDPRAVPPCSCVSTLSMTKAMGRYH